MKTPTPASLSHREIWELLPWQVNGSLDAATRTVVEAHLTDCQACRAELAAQRLIRDAVGSVSRVEQIPAAGLKKLRQRIDQPPARLSQADAAHADTTAEDDTPDAVTAPPGTSGFRWRALPLAAAVLVAAVALGVPAARYWQQAAVQGQPASYFTVTSSSPLHPDAVIRAVFAPTVTLDDLHGMLAEAHLSIVGGPTDAGVYSLALQGAGSPDWSLQRLRSHDSVRFAEAITPGPVPSP